MKINLLTLGAATLSLTTATLFAQIDKTLTPVYPGNVNTITNTNGVGAPGLSRGIIIGGATNSAKTNGLNLGAPGLNKGSDPGEGKGVREVPGVGAAPSVGTAPSVGKSPDVGEAPSVGTAPSLGSPPKIRQ